MPVPVHISAQARFEPVLALAGGAGVEVGVVQPPGFWRSALVFVTEVPPETEPAALPDVLAALPGQSLPEDALAAMRFFLFETFLPRWNARREVYRQAAADLAERVSAAGRADLGRLLGFDIDIDPYRRGLRGSGGIPRLSPNRLAAIELMPSAFNRDGYWQLGAAQGGRQTLYLPCHDTELAALMRTPGAPATKAPPATVQEVGGIAELALVFQALGDTSRFAMARMLARESLTAAEIGRRLGLSAPAVSHHIGALRRAGLVAIERQGASLRLSLRREAFALLGARCLATMFDASTFDDGEPIAPRRSRRPR